MQNIVQKPAAALAAVIAITLMSGNALYAQDLNSGSLITAQDLAFIEAGPVYTQTKIVPVKHNPPAGLITAADYEFVARLYSETAGSFQVRVDPEPVGIITAADYRFLTTEPTVDLFTVHNDFADSLAGQLAR
jgi:CBS domain-containing protein